MTFKATTTTEYQLEQGEDGFLGDKVPHSQRSLNSNSSNSTKSSDSSVCSHTHLLLPETTADKTNTNTISNNKKKKRRRLPSTVRSVCCSKMPEEQHAQRVVIPREELLRVGSIVIEKPKILSSSALDDDVWRQFHQALRETLVPPLPAQDEEAGMLPTCATTYTKDDTSRHLKYFLTADAMTAGILLLLLSQQLVPSWTESVLSALMLMLVVGMLGYHFHQEGLRHAKLKKLVKKWKPTLEASGCTVDYIIPPPSSPGPLMMGCCGCSSCRQPYLYFGLTTTRAAAEEEEASCDCHGDDTIACTKKKNPFPPPPPLEATSMEHPLMVV